MGTALKILFSGRKNGSLHLTRRETVALFNVLGRYVSVSSTESGSQIIRRYYCS